MTAYVATRDVMRAQTAVWHEKYTLPSLWNYYIPSRYNHGAYYFDWTTADEVAWKNFYRVWMSFLNDYKNNTFSYYNSIFLNDDLYNPN